MKKVFAVTAAVFVMCMLFGCAPASVDAAEPAPPVAAEPAAPRPEPEPSQQPSVPEEPTPEEPTRDPQQPIAPEPEPPAAVKDRLLRSTTDGLAVRAGAGTGYAKLGSLDKGDMVPFSEKTGNWYRTLYCGRTAYVSALYSEIVEMQTGDDAVEAVIDQGKRLLGLPYVYGAQRYHWGNGVRNTKFDGKSYDCSSLVQYAFKIGADIDLALTSREQSVQGRAVTDLRRGDLLFFTNASRVGKTGVERIGHVGIYLGDNTILHTASDHAVIEPISSARWGYYLFARRVL